ncbi:MAG: hypothetical protein IT167_03230 [Bryobacterales bacterium]|nr:hypothetical protein [Bryobacterales bacterium]
MRDLEKKQQIARENGSKSKGPITPEGKKRSSLNGITHGLASKCVVLANESQEAYDGLLTAHRTEWQPASLTESNLVTAMVNSYWRLCRIWSMETALFDSEMFTQKGDFEAAWSNHHPAMRAMDAMASIDYMAPGTLDILHRYEVRYERLYRSSMDQLLKLRRLRHAPDITPTLFVTPAGLTAPNAPEDPAPTPEPPPTPANWLTRILAFLLSLLVFLPPSPRKSSKKRSNRTHFPTEPITLPELPPFTFYFPEFFSWLSVFTRDAAPPAQEIPSPNAE